MTVSVEDFRIRFPEFDDETEYNSKRIQMFIEDTTTYIGTDENRWCGNYDKAQAYLAGHLLTVGTNTEVGDANVKSGPIQSKTAGGVSVSRAVQATPNRGTADDFMMTTSYGQQYIVIRNLCFAGVSIATCL